MRLTGISLDLGKLELIAGALQRAERGAGAHRHEQNRGHSEDEGATILRL